MARNILLVESDPILARVIARALEKRHEVTVVPSPEQALRAIGEGMEVDVLLSAYRLRNTTSRRLMTSLKWRLQRPRLVMYADEELRPGARALADVVVHLPGDFRELMQAVEA
jgi:CheY-like chemotaxis protein